MEYLITSYGGHIRFFLNLKYMGFFNVFYENNKDPPHRIQPANTFLYFRCKLYRHKGGHIGFFGKFEMWVFVAPL